MQAKKKTIYKSFKFPVISRKELEMIEEIAIKLHSKYEIEDDNFKYENISQIPDDCDIKNIKFFIFIEESWQSIILYFNKNKSLIIADYDPQNLEVLGAVKRIMDVIKETERKTYWYIFIYTIIATLLNSINAFIGILLHIDIINNRYLLFITLLGSILFLFFLIYLIPFAYTNINLKKEGSLSFFEKNKDNFIINTLFLTIALTLQYVMEKLK